MAPLLDPWLPGIFAAVNIVVLPFWALMVFLPRWRGTRVVMSSLWSVAWLPLAYVALLLPELPKVIPLFFSPNGPPSLAVVRDLLGTDYGTTVAWLHMMAFDLFVGRWIYHDGQECQVSPFLVGPILVLTLLFGPAGLLAWLALRPTAGEPPRRAGHPA